MARLIMAENVGMRNLGLIGGLGPGATVHYYQELVKAHAGEMLIVHADVDQVLGHVARGERWRLAEYLARLIERLAKGGAEVGTIPAVTPHFCMRELRELTVLPLVSVVDAVNAAVHERGYKRVALFGTRYVVESGMFGMLEDIEVVTPDAEKVTAIHDAYMGIVRGGRDGAALLTRIAKELPVDAVLLAGTELSLIFDESNTEFAHVDCTKVHLAAVLRELRGGL